MLLRLGLAFWALLMLPVLAQAAEKFPATIVGEADFTEGDLEKSRREAKEDGLKKAVLQALREEVGQPVIDENPGEVRVKFLNPYADFIKRSGVIQETKAGFRLTLTLGYELDREKLKSRVAAAKFLQAEPKPRVMVVWALEDKESAQDELPEAGNRTVYAAASWMPGTTEPAAAAGLVRVLDDNGFSVIPLSADLQKSITKSLAEHEVSRSFLRDLAAKAGVDNLVFLRVVRRKLVTPPAANLAVERLHNVAFVLEAKTGSFVGSPVATPVVNVLGGADGVGQDWFNRIVSLLAGEQTGATRIVFQGVSSIKQYDSVWTALRKVAALGDVVPKLIAAERAEFSASAAADTVAGALEKAFPEARLERRPEGVFVTLPSK